MPHSPRLDFLLRDYKQHKSGSLSNGRLTDLMSNGFFPECSVAAMLFQRDLDY